ncbi:MAG: hypothetical protein WC830_12335 [Burkholderiales bacterium]|jgi:hypothetical protein
MATGTSLWIQAFGLLLALSGWGKVAYDYVTARPRIRGRIFNVMRGQMKDPRNATRTLTSFVTYLYTVNTRRNSMHLLDFELEIFFDGKWVRLDRVYGIHNVQNLGFNAPDGTEIKIENFSKNLIYRKNEPVDYGKPLHGWIVFAGDASLHTADIAEYRVSCIDAYRKKHVFVTAPKDFENLYLLQDMAGIAIPDSAKSPSNP